MSSLILIVIFVSAYAETSHGGGGGGRGGTLMGGTGHSKPPVCVAWTLSAITNPTQSSSSLCLTWEAGEQGHECASP